MKRSRCRLAQDKIDLLLILALLAVRILFSGLVRLIALPERPQWVSEVYSAATYLLTAAFILRRRSQLSEFHITGCAFAMFLAAPVVSPLLQRLLGEPLLRSPVNWSWRMVLDWPTIAVSIVLTLIFVWKSSEFRLGRDRLSGILLGLGVGLVFGLVPELVPIGGGSAWPLARRHVLSGDVVVTMLVSQLATAAAMEEPLFRGILWGYLRRRGWHWARILIAQAVLFWIGHIYHLVQHPTHFWLWVPLAGIVFGLVAWRTRSVAASMVTHSLANSIGWLADVFRLW